MEEQLISFKTAKLAKHKKFNEPSWQAYGVYSQLGDLKGEKCLETSFENEFGGTFDEQDYDRDDFYLAPTQSLLQKWLREVHSIHICLDTNIIDKKWFFVISNYEINKVYENINSDYYNTYEEALEIGLQETLKLI